VRLDDALDRCEPVIEDGPDGWGASSWGKDGDLSTWSGPEVAEMAFAARAAELEVLGADAQAGEAVVRELLALQASDWAFMVSRDLAPSYAGERFEGHRRALELALRGDGEAGARLRNLAVHAERARGRAAHRQSARGASTSGQRV